MLQGTLLRERMSETTGGKIAAAIEARGQELKRTHPRLLMITAFRLEQASLSIQNRKSRLFVTVIPKPLNQKEYPLCLG